MSWMNIIIFLQMISEMEKMENALAIASQAR